MSLPGVVLRKIKGRLARVGGRTPPPPAAVPAGHPMAFDPATLPWLDRERADIAGYVAALDPAQRPRFDLAEKLEHWRRFGYVVFPKLIPEALIDAYRADLADLVAQRAHHRSRVLIEGVGIKAIRDATDEELRHPHARIMDFHNQSVAAKRIILHPDIVAFLGHVFRDRVVAMQTLTFWRGSEQWTHQDFAYVVSRIPSHLAATWVALEDVHPDAGPLEYFPGSHRLPVFDFGNGMFLTPESTMTDIDFRDFLEGEAAKAGLALQCFAPRKGDVLFWHAALAHRGGTVKDSGLTRLSLVTHYSSATGYPTDRRAPGSKPRILEYNGGWVYADPTLRGDEDRFSR
ncbi:MAG: phytanoyl-CoA dioxygenase family protein [Burkholderiales bacterium]